MTHDHSVVALPTGLRGRVKHGTSLRSALRELGVEIESVCAENATCGKCKVLIADGDFPEHGLTSSGASLSGRQVEEIDYSRRHQHIWEQRGWDPDQVRLACQTRVMGDVVVTVPQDSLVGRQIVRKSASPRMIDIRPSLRKYLVEMTPPTLANPKADWDRLASGLSTSMALVRSGEAGVPRPGDIHIDPAALRELPDVLRESNWRVTVSVWNDREVVRVEGGYTEALIGAAVDIGTTTIGLYLCDLNSGETLAVASAMNPQIAFGEDVMSRIQFSNSTEDGLQQLHKSVIRILNQLLVRAAADAGIATSDILELVMVGNTTMQHLFLNLSPAHLGFSPFVPVTSRPVNIKARDLRLVINPSANVHVLPAIASFIGADTTAVLLSEEPHEQDETWLIIDIGTNAELVLGSRQRLVCASTPTGPAFEGAHIQYGMRAAPGAIEHVRLQHPTDPPEWKLIGEETWCAGIPLGLCGSAVIDSVAELVRVGVIDGSGRFVRTGDHSARLRDGPGGCEYVIAFAGETGAPGDISLTQADVRQIQLAKGALFVAAQSLLEKFGVGSPDRVLLAGAFGSYLDKEKALAIGMLPDVEPGRVIVVGNAAGDGARIALLDVRKRNEAVTLASRVERHELPADPAFQDRFLRALAFPLQ